MTTKKEKPRGMSQKTIAEKKTAAVGKVTPNVAKTEEVEVLNKAQFPIVGIGASAGGLEAFETLFQAMPEDSGIAFVLVAHLDPDHVSILPELIQKKTKMKVLQVEDNMKVAPNQVYIIPPNKEMAIFKGSLQLLEMSQPRGLNLPIDTFLRSLAQDMGHRAIGIILSGTGTDGTLGIRAIKGEAGMVMAQELDSAKYDGMPRSAINTGLVDYILPPDRMPGQLLSYITHKVAIEETLICTEDEHFQRSLQKIFVLLRAATDHDFSLYKKNTISRRIERRMHVHQIDNIRDYVRYLQGSEREISILFKELLIGVTSFFRDPEAYELLKEKYLLDLLKDKPDDYQVRIWVPGCSSGEEAYSVAIILQECMEVMGRHFIVQIFGTDLDEDAINMARAGLYPVSISADVSSDRLKKFFIKVDNHFQVKKNIREMVVFAPQNIIKDPPFTKLDMLCCRNLLIYFGSELQKKLLPIFHYSLKVDGILFLGSSESIGQATDLFVYLDKKWKIFKRAPTEMAAHPVLKFPTSTPAVEIAKSETPKALSSVKGVISGKLLKAILAQSDLPASVVVDDRANIIYIHGRTGRFLEPAEGETSINILDMARPGLKGGLIKAIRDMTVERHEIIVKGLRVRNNGGYVDINLIVRPLSDFQAGYRGMMMIIFEEVESITGETADDKLKSAKRKKNDEVRRLEDELQYTRENLQTTIEELETTNEELKSTNEELQSTNEELQSTNEELETSKEELQSLNEESNTVNSELQSRIDELVEANDDIKNLLDATQIATIFLDIDFNIRRFTPKVTDFLHLTASDIGRPIEHFATTLKDVQLQEYGRKVLTDLTVQEHEVENSQGRFYRMRVRPYRTLSNVIDGVVITFEDISEHKRVLKEGIEKEKQWRGLVENAPMGIFIQTDERFSYINPFASKLFGAPFSEAMIGTSVLDRIQPDFYDMIKKRIRTVISKKKAVPARDEKWLRLDGTAIDLVVSAAPTVYKGKNAALVFIREKI